MITRSSSRSAFTSSRRTLALRNHPGQASRPLELFYSRCTWYTVYSIPDVPVATKVHRGWNKETETVSQTDYQNVQNTALYRLSNRVYFIPDVLGTLFILFRMYRPLRRYIGDGIKKSLYESTTGKRPPSLTGGMRNGWFRNARATFSAKRKRLRSSNSATRSALNMYCPRTCSAA